jgi:hypothetical protein
MGADELSFRTRQQPYGTEGARCQATPGETPRHFGETYPRSSLTYLRLARAQRGLTLSSVGGELGAERGFPGTKKH